MRDSRRWSWPAALVVALMTLGVAVAQDPPAGAGAAGDNPAGAAKAGPNGKTKAKGKRRGPINAPGVPPKNAPRGAADPLAKGAAVGPEWPFHYRFRLMTPDRVELAARFYPSRGGTNAPVAMLIHERGPGHSMRDFEEPIESLEGKGLAEYLQSQDYAVLTMDLRGHGENLRGDISDRQWLAMINDLQIAYSFLVERHNLRQLNIGKLGVIAVGDGADLAAAWAASPSGAISSPGRIGDIGGLVLVSPMEEAQGIRLAPLISALAPRVPIMLAVGQRDADFARAAEPVLARNRLSRVVNFETRLHGDRLLRFEPKVAKEVAAFLEEPVKFRNNSEWEPRFLLNPPIYRDILPEANGPRAEAPAPGAPARKAEEPAVKKAAEPAAPKKKADR